LSQRFNFINIKKLANVLLFVVFFLPAGYLVGGHISLSVNYLFALYPLSWIVYKNKIIIPHTYILSILFLYLFIFVASVLTQMELSQFYVRKFASFFIFMTIFSYFFITIDRHQISVFKISIVLVSLFLTVPSTYIFFSSGVNNFGFEAKGLFGSQRYGFIYIMAFWIIYMYKPIKISWNFLLKYLVLALIIAGILLTFSRSSVVSWLVSLIAYAFYEGFYSKRSFTVKIKWFFTFTFIFIFIFIFIDLYAPLLIRFFNANFLSILFDNGVNGFDFSNINGSEGYRLYMLEKIMKYVTINPFTGSGYLGVWILFDDLSGSAHNQYSDVLFRTGIFGLIAYILLIKKVVSYLFECDKSLFFGFIGVLFYGLFHETFKLSHGGFLLAFLLALAFQKKQTNFSLNIGN
jgi:O-antigen ligase